MAQTKKSFLKTNWNFILIGFVTFSFIFFSWFWTRVPKYSGLEKMSGLIERVEVHRDDFGVPKIFAKNKKDLYFALGYVYASERLFQMQLLKRVISGRLSEIIGKEGLKADKLFRTIGLKRNSKKWLLKNQNKFHSEAIQNLNDYLRGVNYFIQVGKTPVEQTILGIKSESIDIEDVFGFVGFMAFGFAEGFHSDLVISNLEKKLGKEQIAELTENKYSFQIKNENLTYLESWTEVQKQFLELGIPILQGSNSWVISPTKSQNGKVILSNDPHIAFSNPSIWFEAYLHTDDFEIYGHHLPFIPFAVIGFNKNLAWALTMFENDDMDFYHEKINPSNPRQILFKGKPLDMEFQNEVISIKNQNPIELSIRETIHGPIISDIEENSKELISMKWAMFLDNNNPLNSFYKLNQSKSLENFSNSLEEFNAPGLNFVLGTSDGNIAYFPVGGIYKNNFSTDRVLDGESGNFEWGEKIPNPKIVNPKSGYIFTANHKHFDSNKFNIQGYFQADDRSNQIEKNLSSKNSFNIEDMKKLILDDYFDSSEYILKDLIPILESEKLSEVEKVSLEILKSWNKKGELNSVGASIFSELRIHLVREIFLDELGAEDFESIMNTSRAHHFLKRIFQKNDSKFWDNLNTKKIETKKDILLNSFKITVYSLVGKLVNNPIEWTWNKVHTLEIKHPLGKIPLLGKLFNSDKIPVSGGSETINNLLTLLGKNSHEVEAGPSMRMIIDFSRLDEILLINPLGQSGHAFSPFHHDQNKMYTNGEFRKLNFYEMKETDQNKILVLVP